MPDRHLQGAQAPKTMASLVAAGDQVGCEGGTCRTKVGERRAKQVLIQHPGRIHLLLRRVIFPRPSSFICFWNTSGFLVDWPWAVLFRTLPTKAVRAAKPTGETSRTTALIPEQQQSSQGSSTGNLPHLGQRPLIWG